LQDNPSLRRALESSDRVLLCCPCPDTSEQSQYGFPRVGAERKAWRTQAAAGLAAEVEARGGTLLMPRLAPVEAILQIATRFEASAIWCEALATPEELDAVAAIRKAGLDVHETWQSSLVLPDQLPFALKDLPAIFTEYRRLVESARITPLDPLPAPVDLGQTRQSAEYSSAPMPNFRLFGDERFCGAAAAGQRYLAAYFASSRAQRYKATRNEVLGIEGSTKFSPWLATGALSARTIYAALTAHELQHGANQNTYWIWFELLWRDYFKFWCALHGKVVFGGRGFGGQPPTHDDVAFTRWCSGQTGHDFIDAGMRELNATGYLSNRMRQVVASYLVHDLGADWRAGAAWFESRLVDFDVTSNQGNWAYVSGRGADPRVGRRFNPDLQASTYDADGSYRRRWAARGDR
jgi:deoxyribodipyrimidine photo-lyase